MAHNKVYGICESKCKVEVPSMETFNALISRVETLESSVSAIASNVSSIDARVTALEEWKVKAHNRFESQSADIELLDTTIDTLITRVDALEAKG